MLKFNYSQSLVATEVNVTVLPESISSVILVRLGVDCFLCVDCFNVDVKFDFG
jgi:hypothetical protein